jgi:predicted nucleotide-binding protein (sugar kinase/HSP70/actin superfamily)
MADAQQGRRVEGAELRNLLSAEKARLMNEAGLGVKERHYRRPAERPFTAEERPYTTILFGNLTWKHEVLIKAVFHACGYLCERLPTPEISSFHTGKEFCNNGLCNPAYFTAGNLVESLRRLEAEGTSRADIIDRYLYITAGSCGPCRFGMYESEYQQALHNAGFAGFRVLTFQQSRFIKDGVSEPGLKFTMDLGLGILNALNLGDVFYQMAYRIRPYEAHAGDTDKAIVECIQEMAEFLRTRRKFEIEERAPAWLYRHLEQQDKLKRFLNNLGKYREHLYSDEYWEVLERCAARLNQVEVDRTRLRPVVKIVGEFFSQLAEGPANFNMFSFLEKEGAEVLVEPLGNLVLHWLHHPRLKFEQRKDIDAPYSNARWWQITRRLANQRAFLKKNFLLKLGDRLYLKHYRRVAEAFGGVIPDLDDQQELAHLAKPFYDPLARGGEGHLEVGKSIHYTKNRLCHMVLSLKPFGCMPSTQSDGVMAAVVSRYQEMLFLSIETSGEGEINAHSRVQMALGEAKRKARAEFDQALQSTRRKLQDIRDYVFSRPELRRPFYPLPRREGVIGTAANFILHVSKLMGQDKSYG